MAKLTKKRIEELKQRLNRLAADLQYELPQDRWPHTYSDCVCLRFPTRAGKCWMCIVDEIAAMSFSFPKKTHIENGEKHV